MKQNPSKLKFKKNHSLSIKQTSINNKTSYLKNGLYGLKLLRCAELEWKHREIIRRIFKKNLMKKFKFWIHLFTYCPVYKKPLNSRMGKGKGKFRSWNQPIKKNYIICELGYYYNNINLLNSLKKIICKLPGNPIILKLKY